jgi:hypothetical protein
MYEWWNTPRELQEFEDGTINQDFDPKLAEAIDRFRRQLLVGAVNQHIGHLPSSLNSARYFRQKDPSKSAIPLWDTESDINDWEERNSWTDFLGELRIFMPTSCDYEYLLVKSSKELNILVNGHDSVGYIDRRIGDSPIDDPDLLDLLANFFGGLDGIFGLILATNQFVSQELRSDLMNSDYYLTLPNISTRKLLESREQ